MDIDVGLAHITAEGRAFVKALLDIGLRKIIFIASAFYFFQQ